MRRAMTKGLLAVAAWLLTAQAASADGWRIVSPLDIGSGSVYAEPEFSHHWQNLPNWHTGNQPGSTTPFYSTKATVDGNQGGLSVGYRTPSWLPWGQNQRIELSGNIFNLTDHNHQGFSPANPNTQWDTVGGLPSLGTGGVFGTDLVTHLYGGELALRVASDIPVLPSLTVTPAVALFGGISHRANDYIDSQQCAGVLCFQDTVNERVRTAEIGLALTAGGRLALNSSWSLLFGAGAALVRTDADLQARDCFDEDSAAAGCQPINIPGLLVTSSSATASRSDVGGRVNGQLGVRFRCGIAAFDLLGSARYQSSVATIINPSAGGSAVRLGSTGEAGYNVSFRVTVPLGLP